MHRSIRFKLKPPAFLETEASSVVEGGDTATLFIVYLQDRYKTGTIKVAVVLQ